MSNLREVSTLQYMGSKARIITEVTRAIKGFAPKRVVDLFAGTGSVGFSLKQETDVISNDLEFYAYVINDAILNGCVFPERNHAALEGSVDQQYALRAAFFADPLHEEAAFLETDAHDWKEYKRFCESTPAVDYETRVSRFGPMNQLIESLKSGKEPPFDCLFSVYYANTYFGLSQCCEIDAIHSSIEALPEHRCRNVMKAALMSAMSDNASTTTHFAQYLKVNSARSCSNLIEKRKASIRAGFFNKLSEFRRLGLLSCHTATSICLNLGYLEALDSLSDENGTVVYADPPYFKEHYSRYYHILNTLCLYDYPAVALNPQTQNPSVGRYRQERNSSDFGKKSRALPAFEALIIKCWDKGFDLVISYSSNSIVSIDDVVSIMKRYFTVSVEQIPLKHSNQGRAFRGGEKVKEYILSGKRR